MISDERLGKIQHDLECWQQDYDPQYDAENYQLMGDAVKAICELLALRKAFSGRPDAYVVAGSRTYKDRTAATQGIAESILKDRGDDGSRIIPAYRKPETDGV